MKHLKERVEGSGAEVDRIFVKGRVEMAYAETRKGLSEELVDVYQPTLSTLRLEVDGVTVAQIEPGTEEFREAASTLDDIDRMPLYEMLTAPGAGSPHEGADLEIAYREMFDLASADHDLFEAIFDDDPRRTGDAHWVKFRYSAAFKRRDCTREEFDGIRAEYRESRYCPSMTLSDYYTWWRRSQSAMTDDGAITSARRAAALEMMVNWSSDLDAQQIEYWLCRNLSVHPRHRDAYRSLIAEHLAATEEVPPSGPRP